MKAESVLDNLSDGAAFQTAVAPKVDGADSSITFERGGAAVHSPACRTTGMNLVVVGKGGVLRPQASGSIVKPRRDSDDSEPDRRSVKLRDIYICTVSQLRKSEKNTITKSADLAHPH